MVSALWFETIRVPANLFKCQALNRKADRHFSYTRKSYTLPLLLRAWSASAFTSPETRVFALVCSWSTQTVFSGHWGHVVLVSTMSSYVQNPHTFVFFP